MRRINSINRKAQSLIEYSFVLVIVLSVFIFMETYLKRGVQAGIKISADQLGKQEDAAYTTDPREGSGVYNYTTVSTTLPGQPNRKTTVTRNHGGKDVDSYDKRVGYSFSETHSKDNGWYYVPSGNSASSVLELHRYGEENEE
ncbi:MAG: hypothetical protein KJ880_04610 [Candidatus Omnitrophica bacterium]|nr:hypothetical protein [Candidatus Omnitrophota bacterium]MBU1869560.1 hypothetical protein [Candidatus Omnitrophota bacterium]